MAYETKSLMELITSVIQCDYYNEKTANDGLLDGELFGMLSDEEFKSLVQRIRSVIKSMAGSDMDHKQAETFLVAQTKKHDGGLTQDQARVFQQCWKIHQSRIHECLIESCTWNSRLCDVSWRIDTKPQSRNVRQINVAGAIVEIQLESAGLIAQGVEMVRFEADDRGLGKILRGIKEIEELVGKHARSPVASSES